jgi:hypothetical protein
MSVKIRKLQDGRIRINKRNGTFLLFKDEFTTITEREHDAFKADLKPYVLAGKLRVVGNSNYKEYKAVTPFVVETASVKEEEKKEVETEEDLTYFGVMTKEMLDKMSYFEIKAKAKDLGLKTGRSSKDTLINKILEKIDK